MIEPGHIPTATFRVQLNADFPFEALDAQIAYLRALGITDFYLPPIFTASPSSSHGYDVNDYTTVSAELGGESGFERLADRLRQEHCGLIVDMVPNHMGIAGPRNAWWHEVLESGRNSAYADFFDIHWNTVERPAGDRVLLPMLADHYGKILEEGKIALVFERAFFLRYEDALIPVNAGVQAELLGALADRPDLPAQERHNASTFTAAFTVLAKLEKLTDPSAARDRARQRQQLKAQLGEWVERRHGVRACVQRHLEKINGVVGKPESFAALNTLIAAQHYRLARWNTGAHEINYRRFFAINSLVGLRMENPAVFAACHALISRYLRDGRIAGLRIDHIDGLRDPAQYLQRLQSLARPQPEKSLFVVVEKILAAGEVLPADWPAHGTTGYEFIPQMAGLLMDGATEGRITEIYARFTGQTTSYADAVYAKKRLILDELFANTVTDLGTRLTAITRTDRLWQDMTRQELTSAIREILAALQVYRTYRASDRPPSPADRLVLEAAYASAVARNPRLDPQPMAFVRDLLVGDYPPEDAPAPLRQQALSWALTFQQYTGAIMAKSVEDTVFYTYCRFIALNEVGGNPSIFGASLEDFHGANRTRLATSPHTLLATSTHDTKLSEDVRCRLYALSELADDWGRWIENWHALNEPHLTGIVSGTAPDRLDEYRLYQILLGAWPLAETDVNDIFRARLRQHFRKAVEEAKRHTSPLRPNVEYLSACDRFVDRVTTPATAPKFLADFTPCAHRIALLGMVNSLTQLVLKCTVPGVPDFYQGNEIWDFSLVDPDNRRPVDYERRRGLQTETAPRPIRELMTHWRDGAIKLRTMQCLLRFRAAHTDLFRRGTYEPVPSEGACADHAVAFIRRHAGRAILVVVPRLTHALGQPPLGAAWGDTALRLGQTDSGDWCDIFTERKHIGAATLRLSEALADLPFAVLEAPVADRPSPPL